MIQQLLSTKQQTAQITLNPQDNQRLAHFCGPYDENIQQIAQDLGVTISRRSYELHIRGDAEAVKNALEVLPKLYQSINPDEPLTEAKLHRDIKRTEHPETEVDPTVIRTPKASIKSSNKNQATYLQNIATHDINFSVGPAGTGKTYLAVACAVSALEKDEVQRILLVRPAIEAGEKLGFLPGDLEQKVLPYLRPLYDALYEMLGTERVNRYIEKDIIEIAPLAYMRGRTLNDAFVILDEGQNTTIDQMKMFLTRIGFGSKAVVTGDITQVDLPSHMESGLEHATVILDKVPGISTSRFTADDTVRHPLVKSIIKAYERDHKAHGDR